MLEILAKRWWAVVLRGVLAVVFGVLAVVWPGITLLALVLLFGAYALVDGAVTLAAAFGPRRPGSSRAWLIVEGVAGILAGILAFVWPDITALVLLWLIAAWAIVTGVLEVVAAVRLRKEITGEWLLALSGVLSVLFGILLVLWPTTGALAVVLLIAAYAVVFGAVLIGLGLRLRRLRGPAPAEPAGVPAQPADPPPTTA